MVLVQTKYSIKCGETVLLWSSGCPHVFTSKLTINKVLPFHHLLRPLNDLCKQIKHILSDYIDTGGT